MAKKDKKLALELLRRREAGEDLALVNIGERSGYERKQLGRLASEIRGGADDADLLAHGNLGRVPATAATDAERAYLRALKERYPAITIAQFRDIYIEDVIENPDMAGDVCGFGLRKRSESWFRALFAAEGWASPAQRPPLRDGRSQHPLRPPAPRRGELVQVDGCDADWLRAGEPWCMHLAVDDATTEALGAWFMPTECTRGYCRLMSLVLEGRGLPLALYSDKAGVFRSVKNGAPSQFALMMADLGIRMAFAGSSQAKGRVERYNRTVQLRLPNDLVRFGIGSYDEANAWFNSFYAGYLNAKLSFLPRDPADAWAPLPPGLDLSRVFRGRYARVVRGGAISFEKTTYLLVDGEGEPGRIPDGTRVAVFRDAFTGEVYVERAGARYACAPMGARGRAAADGADDGKAVAALLREYRNR